MSLPVDEHQVAALRAWAHPLRLRMLSLLTGAAMSAAELARELGVSQALASYHLRQLASAHVVELAEERSRRGGQERRYRYLVPVEGTKHSRSDSESYALFTEALVIELRRRAHQRVPGMPGLGVDAELWLRPADWEAALEAITSASRTLHERARPPHEPGTVKISTSVAMFVMDGPGAAGRHPADG